MAKNFNRRDSEKNLRRHLDLSRAGCAVRPSNRRRRDAERAGAGKGIPRLPELGMVEEVEEFEAELQLYPLRNPRVFEQSGVEIDHIRAIELIFADIGLLIV